MMCTTSPEARVGWRLERVSNMVTGWAYVEMLEEEYPEALLWIRELRGQRGDHTYHAEYDLGRGVMVIERRQHG